MALLPVRAPGPAALVLCAILHTATPVGAGPETPGWTAVERARAHFRALRADSALALVGPVLAGAEAARDPRLAASARLLQGASLASLARFREAEPALGEAVRLSGARSDSLTLASALRFHAYALNMLGRPGEAVAASRRLLAVSLALRDSLGEAYARHGLAYADLLGARYAEAANGYGRAVALFRGFGEGFLQRDGTIGLGRCYEGLGRFDDARRCYLEVDSLAAAAGDGLNRGSALNNLGAMEHMTGDLAAAERHYLAAYELHRDSRTRSGGVAPATNLALVQIERGRLREAGHVLEEALAGARATGGALPTVQVLGRLAELRAAEDRFPEALAHAREGLALARSLPAPQRIPVVWALGSVLAQSGAEDEALRLLQAESATLDERSPAYAACGLRLQLARGLLRADRPAEALRVAHAALADARRGGSLILEFRARVREGLAQLALGRTAAARATLDDATALWEADRGRQRSPEAREHLGATARECAAGLVAAHLAGAGPDGTAAGDSAVAAVFATIERFKGRTLRERMAGPWGARADGDPARGAPDLEALQRSVLREGELFLQAFLGRRDGVIVAVTRETRRIVALPAGEAFRTRLRTFRALAARPGAGEADGRFVEEAGRRLGEALLAPLRDLLPGVTRILVSPDAELGLMPWSALAAPGPTGGGDAGAPLAREVVLVPSAAILADLRGREPAPAASRPRLLAVAGRGGADDEALPGARREVRWLAGRYAGVEARDDQARAALEQPGWMESFDALHFAAHTTLDDQHPWRSGIRLAAAGTAGRDGYLRADRIAALRLRARLAVLSSCESAGGRLVSGEGVGSLSAAFVSAGVPATVATLWPVGDRVTGELMRVFYRRLAAGRTVAAALREAQLEIRGRAATRHPFHWAGFVVLGDPDVRLPLRRRPLDLAIVIAIATAIGTALLAAWRVRRDSAVTKPGGVTPIP